MGIARFKAWRARGQYELRRAAGPGHAPQSGRRSCDGLGAGRGSRKCRAQSAPLYPAADPDVIAVTATDSRNCLFKAASRGAYVAVAAPEVGILALAPGDSYQITTGTSIAAAHVGRVAALLLQREPSLKSKDIRSILTATAKPLTGAVKQRSDFGVGLVDAYGALGYVDRTSAKR
jgi:subtilisin family serine protease